MRTPPDTIKYFVRAQFSEYTIRIYQAYRAEIAEPALLAGRFVPPFQMARMTWIKPSFNWMMYRSGFATKAGQEYVLGIDITREGFEWALKNGALSHYRPDVHSSPESWAKNLSQKCVRIQWDPERDWKMNEIKNVRSIQIGLSGEAVRRYVSDWIVKIEDLTPVARRMALTMKSSENPPDSPVSREIRYPLDETLYPEIFPRAIE